MTKDWESVQADIRKLSVDQKKSLEDVKAIMESRYKFRASVLMNSRTRAYRMKLKEWGYMRHRPRRAPEDQSRPQDEDPQPELLSPGNDMCVVADDSTVHKTLVDETEELIPVTCPWSLARNPTTKIVIQMLTAVLEGNVEHLEELIMASPAQINSPIGKQFEVDCRFFNHPAMHNSIVLEHSEQTLLDIACALPFTPIVWSLLEHGAIGSRSQYGTDLALHNAIKNGRTNTVQTLLHSGHSNVSGPLGGSWTPLSQAIFWIKLDIVRLLLDRGAVVNETSPVVEGTPFKTGLQMTLDRRAEFYSETSKRESCGKILKMLLEAGADIHIPPAQDAYGMSPTPFEAFIKPWQRNPLWIAQLTQTEIECMEAFVRKGANLQVSFNAFPCSAKTGNTFEHQVLWHSTPLAARLLVDHAVPSQGANGANLLHEIVGSCPDAKRHPTDTLRDIEVLLYRGANPNLQDRNGVTPLQRCIESCPAVDIVPRLQKLLDGGADPELKDTNGLQLIFLAAQTVDEPLKSHLVQLLISTYRGRQSQGQHTASTWTEAYFPIPGNPTFTDVMRYTEQNHCFMENIRRIVPEGVQSVFLQAAFSVASRSFLKGVVKRMKLRQPLTFPANERDQIRHIITLRRNHSLPDYNFDQEFVMLLLGFLTASPDISTNVVLDAMDTSTGGNQLAPIPDQTVLPLCSSTAPGLPTLTPLGAMEPARRASMSSTSSNDTISSFFVPTTTEIRWPLRNNWVIAGERTAAEEVLRYKCKSCRQEPMLTEKEYKKHEDEHWHSINCNYPLCRRRFCIAERNLLQRPIDGT